MCGVWCVRVVCEAVVVHAVCEVVREAVHTVWCVRRRWCGVPCVRWCMRVCEAAVVLQVRLGDTLTKQSNHHKRISSQVTLAHSPLALASLAHSPLHSHHPSPCTTAQPSLAPNAAQPITPNVLCLSNSHTYRILAFIWCCRMISWRAPWNR